MTYKILIIEDVLITLNVIANVLDKDYDIYIAKNGEEGLELYNKIKPDIIICDINLPKLNGLDLIKLIRKNDQNTKIIVISVHDDVQTLLKANELKLLKYLIKPIDNDELLECVEASIEELNNFSIVQLENIKISEKLIWKKNEYQLYENGVVVKLSPKEKKVLAFLLKKPNQTRTYEEIIYEIWEKDSQSADKKSLKTFITSLRKKVNNINIENINSVGYRLITES